MVEGQMKLEEAITDRAGLISAIERGARPKYLCFWGHKPLPSGEIGKPAASALVHCMPRSELVYVLVRSQTARQPPENVEPSISARYIS